MIAIKKLTKLYRNGRGVKDLTFTVSEGEAFGYLGPNGAGKTTTIRNLLGFLRPDKGTCTIKGLDCWKESEAIRKSLGYIPDELAFFNEMRGTAFLDFLFAMRKTKDRKRISRLLELFQLDPSEHIKEMSKGTKQKLGIVAACMHDPAVMIFDEPSAGLDPLMQVVFVKFILEEKSRGKTLFISSHSFDEITRTCDRVAIIRDGMLADVQDILELNRRQRKQFIITVSSSNDVKKLQASRLQIVTSDGCRLEIMTEGNPDQFIKIISQVSVENIELKPMMLEQVFMHYFSQAGDMNESSSI